MPLYPPEHLLVTELEKHDALVRAFANGAISFDRFCGEYGNFYWSLALDGHESDEAGLALLKRYEPRIAPHRAISEQALAGLSNPGPEGAIRQAAIAVVMAEAANIRAGEI
jgi:hypothetical protein